MQLGLKRESRPPEGSSAWPSFDWRDVGGGGQAQRFLNLVVLPHVRQDIRQNKRLHFALYQALRKAAFKADAFYKVGPRRPARRTR